MDTPTGLAPGLTPGDVIDGVLAARSAEQAAALAQLELAVVWAALHPCGAGETSAYWGGVDLHGETTIWLSGEGSPTVAEFAPVELAAALGITVEAGHQLLADAVELHHRLPRFMVHVRSGVVPAWLARRIAALTTDLSWDAVVFVDKLLSATPERIGQCARSDWSTRRVCSSTPTGVLPRRKKPWGSAGCGSAGVETRRPPMCR
jgi:hypothetical protein